MQDYKSLCAPVTICSTLVNIQTDTHTHGLHLTSLYTNSAGRAKNQRHVCGFILCTWLSQARIMILAPHHICWVHQVLMWCLPLRNMDLPTAHSLYGVASLCLLDRGTRCSVKWQRCIQVHKQTYTPYHSFY